MLPSHVFSADDLAPFDPKNVIDYRRPPGNCTLTCS